MEEKLELDVQQGFKLIAISMFVDLHAIERVALGFEKPGDKAPIDLYLKNLRLEKYCDDYIRSRIQSRYIDEQERISTKYNYEDYVRELFVSQMESIFEDEPKDELLENDYEDIPFLPSLREYLFRLLPLFTEVMTTQADPFLVKMIPTKAQASVKEIKKRKRFVIDIMRKPLEAGSNINTYVNDLSTPPDYIDRLIECKGDNYYLKCADVENYKYIFALFSLMKFTTAENFELFELKMFEWEQQNMRKESIDKDTKAVISNLCRKFYGE